MKAIVTHKNEILQPKNVARYSDAELRFSDFVLDEYHQKMLA